MVRVNILRKKDRKSDSFFQHFNYEGDLNIPVNMLIENINRQSVIKDIHGSRCEPINWSCSCEQGVCGACAMVINDIPRLACNTFCNELLETSNEITIKPLSKFPCIKDLEVDRASLFEIMKEMCLWLDEKVEIKSEKAFNQQGLSECLMCGCCLEACTNYKLGDTFSGPVAAVNTLRVLEQLTDEEHKKQVKKDYKKNIFKGCSNSLTCQSVCPKKIPINYVMSKMNKYSVWKFWQLISER